MTEANASRIDPRFDPRFQRGYVPDAAGPEPTAEPASDVRERSGPADRSAPVTEPASRPAGSPPSAGSRPAGGAESVLASLGLGPTGREPEVGSDAERRPVPSASPAEPALAPAKAEAERAFAALVEPSNATSSWAARGWFIAGWCVAAAAAAVGASLWWASVANLNYFSGPTTESDRWLQTLGWTIAPSLIETGLLGLVVMLVWTGVRHARRHEEAE